MGSRFSVLPFFSKMVVPLLIFLLGCLNGFTTAELAAGYHFPIFPQGLFAQGAGDRASSNAVNKKIPRSFWIAVVNASEVAEWPHIVHLKKSNPNWALNLCDNAAKDSFMRENFYGTSLLWAYENINPAVGGAARADIWRYAVLFLKGGVYIDADSALSGDLDNVIKDDDELVITYETNTYDGDWCYSSNSHLSTIRTLKLFPAAGSMALFHNRNILNWCIMSAPKHLFLKRALENFVHLMKLEYIGLSALKMQKYDQYSKHIYCTTGPYLLTASCREAVLQLNDHLSSNVTSSSPKSPRMYKTAEESESDYKGNYYLNRYRLGSRDFIKEGGRFKVVNTVKGDSNHYTKVGGHHSFLLQSAGQNDSIAAIVDFIKNPDMEGALIMGRFHRSVYVLDKGTRRPVGGMDIFNAYNFSLTQIIHLSDFVISQISLGETLSFPPNYVAS